MTRNPAGVPPTSHPIDIPHPVLVPAGASPPAVRTRDVTNDLTTGTTADNIYICPGKPRTRSATGIPANLAAPAPPPYSPNSLGIVPHAHALATHTPHGTIHMTTDAFHRLRSFNSINDLCECEKALATLRPPVSSVGPLAVIPGSHTTNHSNKAVDESNSHVEKGHISPVTTTVATPTAITGTIAPNAKEELIAGTLVEKISSK